MLASGNIHVLGVDTFPPMRPPPFSGDIHRFAKNTEKVARNAPTGEHEPYDAAISQYHVMVLDIDFLDYLIEHLKEKPAGNFKFCQRDIEVDMNDGNGRKLCLL